jgi:hypothetical protein
MKENELIEKVIAKEINKFGNKGVSALVLSVICRLKRISDMIYTKIASMDDVEENYTTIQRYVDIQQNLVESAKLLESLIETDFLSDFHSKEHFVDIDENFKKTAIELAESVIMYLSVAIKEHDKMAVYSDKVTESIKHIEKFEEELYAI